MRFSSERKRQARMVPVVLAVGPVLALMGCTDPIDYDLRGNIGGFTTADAALTATANRPKPDARGVITYPNYQVAVARDGDTALTVAQRLGINGAELAKFNGVEPNTTLRKGEILALPRKLPDAGSVDIEALAGQAIDSAPKPSPVETTALAPAAKPAAKPAKTPVQPGPEPVRHKVERGETAYTIARLYQVSVKSLAEWNGLGSDFAIREGQYLLIPVASGTPPQRAASPVEEASTTPGQGTPTPTPPSASQPLPDEKVAAASTAAAGAAAQTADVGTPSKSTSRMALPVQGRIIRPYAKGKNDGIDIAGSPGASVSAAASGTVAAITSDADKVPIIVVRHPDNLMTVYANVDGIKVKKGDKVKRGQNLATLRSGDDSYVHFEVREGFDSVDPAPYLE